MSCSVDYFDFEKTVAEIREWIRENKDEIHLLAELSRTRRKLAELEKQKQQQESNVSIVGTEA